MTITVPANYQTEHNKLFRTPVYQFEIEGYGQLSAYFAEVLRDDPVAFYALSENVGTVITGPLIHDNTETAIFFNGTSNYIDVGDADLLDLTTPFTLEAWIKKSALSSERYILDKDAISTLTNNSFAWSVNTSGGMTLYRRNSDSASSSNSVITAGLWYHVVVVFDNNATPRTRFYVNGVAAGTSTGISGAFVANTQTLLIGRRSTGLFWDGGLANIALYNYAVEPERLAAHYSAAIYPFGGKFATHKVNDYNPEVLRDSPSVYYTFGEISGTTVEDATANNVDGQYLGGFTLGVEGALIGDTANTSVLLTAASSGRVIVPDHALLDPGDTFTLEIIIRRTRTGTLECICDKGTNGYQLRINASDQLELLKTGTGVIATSTQALSTINQFYHIIVTKNASNGVVIFIDGQDKTGTVTNQIITATSTDLNIGRTAAAASHFDGRIDEFALYPVVLSIARCRVHYLASVARWTLVCLKTPQGISGTIVPGEGRSSIGNITDVLIDKDYRVTQLVTEGILGKTVIHRAGFEGLPENDFCELPVMSIDDYEMLDDATGFQFICRDAAVYTNKTVFEVASTTLLEAATSVDTTLSVVDGNFFQSTGYLLIDEEIMSFSGKTATTLTGLVRGLKGTTAAAHDEDSQVQEMIILGPAHPYTIAQQVMTNTDNSGMSIDAALIDTASFTNAITATGSSTEMEFRITERENGKEWLEREIYAITASYPKVTAVGAGVKVFRQPIPADVAGTINEDSILKTPKWKADGAGIINRVTYLYDWNAITGKFESKATYEDTDSQALYGVWPLTYESKGLRTSLAGTASLIEQRSRAILRRYANGAPLLICTTQLQKNLLEPGDIVQVTSSIIPNRDTKGRGVTDFLMEVVNRDINWSDATVKFELLAAGWNGLLAVIAPAGQAAYTASTSSEKAAYMFVSTTTGLNPDGTLAATIGAD